MGYFVLFLAGAFFGWRSFWLVRLTPFFANALLANVLLANAVLANVKRIKAQHTRCCAFRLHQ
ncbi:MAG: hypothetical protein CL578_09075 [Alteromonadaceae bacterium]|nr:hypothetical protein [Alteromonadaceae bacterium]|tara:strand:- start:2391 stop:2579 length:189 start_codon:yes stop_codon:yes gene_type:complete